MPVKDPYGLRVKMVNCGLTNKEMAAILTKRGFNACPTTVSKAINGDGKTHSSNVRVAMITYFKELENGKKA